MTLRLLRWLTHAPVLPLPGLRTSDYQAQRQTDAEKSAEAETRIAEVRARLAALELAALHDAHTDPHDHDS